MLRRHACCLGVLVTYTASGHDLVRVMISHKRLKRDKQDETEKRRNENRERCKKIGETESVIGLAVDEVLETCVKPGALTDGFRERGKGYGLESVYFIL